jgi:hypothetical protein
MSCGKGPKRPGADFSTGTDLVWGQNALFALESFFFLIMMEQSMCLKTGRPCQGKTKQIYRLFTHGKVAR